MPRLDQNIGFALLQMEWAKHGEGLAVETEAGEATFAEMPFIDPKKQIRAPPAQDTSLG